jgi:hypothetical protein
MKEKAEEFKRTGAKIYHEVTTEDAEVAPVEFKAAPKE